MSGDLRVQSGGTGDPVLVLLHGLGATGDVWRGVHELLPSHWPGRWVTPDLPGHGGSKRLPTYSFEAMAAAIAPTIPASNRIVVLGHSLGGVVALALAGRAFGVEVTATVGLGIKVSWTEEELGRARALAARPNPEYPTRAEAAERYLKVAGLVGMVAADAVPDAALVEKAGKWTLAFDPGAFAVGAPDMQGLLAAARGTVTLAAGEHDPMSPADQLRSLVADPIILAGLGHNAHVESPNAIGTLLEAVIRR